MVERLQKRITFVDLDGTLLTCNSMREFMRMLPGRLMHKHFFYDTFKVLYWMGLRSLHLIGHRRMKWHLIRIARQRLASLDWGEFAAQLMERLDKKVVSLILDEREKGNKVYIASAAPEEYTEELCKKMKFDGWIATSFFSFDRYTETRGETKLERIKEILDGTESELSLFLTDHPDDLPTVKAFPERSIIVRPTNEAEVIFRSHGVTRFIY